MLDFISIKRQVVELLGSHDGTLHVSQRQIFDRLFLIEFEFILLFVDPHDVANLTVCLLLSDEKAKTNTAYPIKFVFVDLPEILEPQGLHGLLDFSLVEH